MTRKKYLIRYLLLKLQVGNYVLGDLVLSERALSLKFDVSRETVRSALKFLSKNNFIINGVGQGNTWSGSFHNKINGSEYIKFTKSIKEETNSNTLPLFMLSDWSEKENDRIFTRKYLNINNEVIGVSYFKIKDIIIPTKDFVKTKSLLPILSDFGHVLTSCSQEIRHMQDDLKELKGRSFISINAKFYEFDFLRVEVTTYLIPRYMKIIRTT